MQEQSRTLECIAMKDNGGRDFPPRVVICSNRTLAHISDRPPFCSWQFKKNITLMCRRSLWLVLFSLFINSNVSLKGLLYHPKLWLSRRQWKLKLFLANNIYFYTLQVFKIINYINYLTLIHFNLIHLKLSSNKIKTCIYNNFQDYIK